MDQNLESKKVFIDQDLWYIPNFLTADELNFLKTYCDEPNGWYLTSRSTSIRNKFIGIEVDLHPEGTVCPTRGIDLSLSAKFPTEENKRYQEPLFWNPGGALDRMDQVLPKNLNKDITLQSFWPLDDSDHSGAYNYHYEATEENMHDDFVMTGAWSLYLNDDFEGGLLEFANKEYKVSPEVGMLVNIPMTKEFTHRVTPVISGVRHTMYGVCYLDLSSRPVSNGETC